MSHDEALAAVRDAMLSVTPAGFEPEEFDVPRRLEPRLEPNGSAWDVAVPDHQKYASAIRAALGDACGKISEM